jgi:iron complex transport system substrate-binding protein
MNRKTQILVVAVTAILLLAGVVWLTTKQSASLLGGVNRQFSEVTDMTGQRAQVPATPRRVLSLCTTATDTLVGLGVADHLVAIDEFSGPVPGSEHAVIVGKGSAISRERVAALKIDLAFIWWYQDDAAAMLTDLSIPVVRIRSTRVSELPATIRLIGDCLDRRDAADGLAGRIEACTNRPTTRPGSGGTRVFLELYGPFKTVGRDTYTNDLLELAGCSNVAAQAKGSVVFSAEKLLQADPDVILCVGEAADAGALAQRPGASDLRAVRQGRVAALDRYWLVAGPNMPQSVEKIRAAIAACAAKP